jgi:hypothetical protein
VDTLNRWLSVVHPLLEALYYLSAVALAVLAFKGLEQLKISREIAKTSARREAFKLAADECRYFAEQIIPLGDTVGKQVVALKLSSFLNPKFKVVNGEIIDHNFSIDDVAADMQKSGYAPITLLNRLEAFSIFFAELIAEESVAYQETAATFCGLTRQYMSGIFFLRGLKTARYKSTVMLYERWSAKLKSEQLMEEKKAIDKNLEGLDHEPLKPIGT